LELRDDLGARSWGLLTDTGGHWSATLGGAFRRKARWQALYLGEAGLAAAEAAPHVVYVVPKLVLRANLNRVRGHYVVRHGTTFTTKGTSTPNMAGAVVLLQWRTASGSTWRTGASAQVASGGAFATRGSWSAPGRYYMRWHYSGAASKPWMAANSAKKLFVVR
jgi:hypothetical protein